MILVPSTRLTFSNRSGVRTSSLNGWDPSQFDPDLNRYPPIGGMEWCDLILSELIILVLVRFQVAPSVQGLYFKDLKQILRKEQCDGSILITANVPSAKKIVVHGPLEPEAGGIPSQFPVQEDTQFLQILQESLDFFSIDENKQREYFLVDYRTSNDPLLSILRSWLALLPILLWARDTWVVPADCWWVSWWFRSFPIMKKISFATLAVDIDWVSDPHRISWLYFLAMLPF